MGLLLVSDQEEAGNWEQPADRQATSFTSEKGKLSPTAETFIPRGLVET